MEPADPAQLQLKLRQQDAILESQQQQLLAVMQCVQTMTHQIPGLRLLLLPQTWVQCHHHRRPVWASTSLASHHQRGMMDPPGSVGASWPSVSSSLTSNPALFPLTPPGWLTSSFNLLAKRRSGELQHGVLSSPAPSRHVDLCKRCIASSTGPRRGSGDPPASTGEQLLFWLLHRDSDFGDWQRLGRVSPGRFISPWSIRADQGRAANPRTSGRPGLDYSTGYPDRFSGHYARQRSPPRYFQNRRRPSPTLSSHPPPTPSPIKIEPGTETEAMMVDRSKLMKEERDRRVRNRACLYCGWAGYFASNCPVKWNKEHSPISVIGLVIRVLQCECPTRSGPGFVPRFGWPLRWWTGLLVP